MFHRNTCNTFLFSNEFYEYFFITRQRNVMLNLLIKFEHVIYFFSVGRMTSRLPEELADEVLGSLLELFTYDIIF